MSERLDRYRQYMLFQGWSVDYTITDRLELLRRVIADLGDLRAANLEQFVGWLARDYWSNATRANYQHHINSYLNWEVQFGDLPANPLARIKPPQVPKGTPRPTRLPQWWRIVEEAIPKWRTCALLAGLGGLRSCEVARLRRLDVDEELIVIRKAKGSKYHEVATHPMVWDAVKGLPPGPIAPDRHGRHYTPASLSNMFAVYCRNKLGIDTSLHPLRHRFCSDLRYAGYDLKVVQKAARHESLKTTEIYTEVEQPEVREAIRSLRPRPHKLEGTEIRAAIQSLRPAA